MLVLALALLLAAAPGTANGAAAAPAGAAAQELPPFLGAGGRLSEPHPMGCAPGWIWYSAEEWWRRELQPINASATDFGHAHVQGCWPHLLTMSAPFKVDVTTVLFENTGSFADLRVGPSGAGKTGLNAPSPGCPQQTGPPGYLGYTVYCAPKGMNRTAAT